MPKSCQYSAGMDAPRYRSVANEEVTARVVTLDRPSGRAFQRSVLGDEGTVFAANVSEFTNAVAVSADLLVISTHGRKYATEVGYPRNEWVDIASLDGRCTTLLVVACYQTRDRAVIWAKRFHASEVVLAEQEPPSQTADRAIKRVLDRPETWRDGEAVMHALLDTTRPAPVMERAGWYVHR